MEIVWYNEKTIRISSLGCDILENRYNRILTIQDISCVGQCSMTVALPILSACGLETCVLPTAILSTHTGGFGQPVRCALADIMLEIKRHWKEQKIEFDLIYTGYLGSVEAIQNSMEIIDELLAPGGMVVVDPAMADHGKLYSGLSPDYAKHMKELCFSADVMIPNITEAAMMAGISYQKTQNQGYIQELLEALGGKTVVLTGVKSGENEIGAAVRHCGVIRSVFHPKLGGSFHGTGDIFASTFSGAIARGESVAKAAEIAGEFTYKCIAHTVKAPAHWYGVKFETALPELMAML